MIARKELKVKNAKCLMAAVSVLAMSILATAATAQLAANAAAAEVNDNASRKRNCELAGGTHADATSSTFTCTLRGDTGTASVTCTEGQRCTCTGSACDEFGGPDAIESGSPGGSLIAPILVARLAQTVDDFNGRGGSPPQFVFATMASGRQFGQRLEQPPLTDAPIGTTQFPSVQGRNSIAFAAPMAPGGPGGNQVGIVECDLDCCVACCRDCFPVIGCVDYPCCELSDCKIGF